MESVRGWRMSAGVLATVGLALAALVGTAAAEPASSFECRPRATHAAKPPPLPDLPPQATEKQQRAIEADHFHPLCPRGEVPYPTGGVEMKRAGPPVLPNAAGGASASRARRTGRTGRGPGASASRLTLEGAWYSWAIGYQEIPATTKANGVWVTQTNEQPYIDYQESLNYAHSIGQLWAIGWGANGNCWSTAETGWSESAGNYGDVYPHLFVYAYDCGVRIGEAGKALPWVQSSNAVYPRAAITHNDTFHTYGARMDGNNWWIYYDGQWVGYIPHSAWKQYFPSFVRELEAGGEVETPNYYTCTDMGYASLYGTHPWAADFSDVWYEFNYNQSAASAWMLKSETDPGAYNTGNWAAGYPGSEFRYGGPGWC